MDKLHLFKTFDGYVGKLNLSKEVAQSSKESGSVETIIVLDKSGSMDIQVNRIVTQILPGVFRNLGYQDNDSFTIVAFDNTVKKIKYKLWELPYSTLRSGATTYMNKAVSELGKVIESSSSGKFRILTISDGMVFDQEETVNTASKLSKEINEKYKINSQAVRFMNGGGDPDTRGLASILQLNSGETKLIDVKKRYGDNKIISMLTELFTNDGLDLSVQIKGDGIKTSPWSQTCKSSYLSEGENTLWFNTIPDLTINGKPVEVELIEDVDDKTLYDEVKSTIDYYTQRMKILKAVNTQYANDEVSNILKYFEKFSSWLATLDKGSKELMKDSSLMGRVQFLKNNVFKRKAGFINSMRQIANDERVSTLNSKQLADYLREINLGKNAKGLARRAETYGLDFTETVKNEVRRMKAHLDELNDIDDENHNTSFYSQDTTLGGIKAVCSIENNLLDEMEVTDILQLINIVGVACNGPVGDYPDPMTWRLNDIYPGCYISLSDILMGHVQSGGQNVTVPGQPDKIINNIIPIFDDERVHRFLKTYAPNILEYSASIGMRRVIVGIPMTHAYTICAGVWKMVEVQDKNKSSVCCETFLNLTRSLETSFGTYFDHVLPYIREQDQNISYYICNNGLTNMILPIFKLVRSGNTWFMDRILRSIYSFETYQLIKKNVRDNSNSNDYVRKTLNSLLGLDLEKNTPGLKPFFEKDEEPDFYDHYKLDTKLFNKFSNMFWFMKYSVIIPDLFEAFNKDDPIEHIKSIPTITDEMVCKKLGIDTHYNSYLLYSIVQSFLFRTNQSRVDDEKKVMLVTDLGYLNNGEDLVRNYVRKEHKRYWYTLLGDKKRKEKIEAVNILVSRLINSDTGEFKNLLKNGIEVEGKMYYIENTMSLGYEDLRNAFLDTNMKFPYRIDKLMIFLTGKDESDKIVWNNGNVIRNALKDFDEVYRKEGAIEEFGVLKEYYRKNNLHIYRPMSNRHGHSNDKPSFWALGYKTIGEMASSVSKEEWDEYKGIHIGCCGL